MSARESLARPSLVREVLRLVVDPVREEVVRRMLPLDVLVSALSP